MPDQELLRAALREHWHLLPQEIITLPRPCLSDCWEVVAGPDRYVARLSEPGAGLAVEAGLAATHRLRHFTVAAGEPVRTLGGGLTVRTPAGVLAVLRRVPGRMLDGGGPIDQQFWGDRLGAVHRALQGFQHPGLRSWQPLDPEAAYLSAEPWLRPAVAAAVTAATRLTVTDRLTYGVLHGDPSPGSFVLDPESGKAGVLDCGVSGTGPLVYDVAAAVIYAGGADHATELLDGYVSAGPVHADEIEAALPVMLRLRWAALAAYVVRKGCSGVLPVIREALESMPG